MVFQKINNFFHNKQQSKNTNYLKTKIYIQQSYDYTRNNSTIYSIPVSVFFVSLFCFFMNKTDILVIYRFDISVTASDYEVQ